MFAWWPSVTKFMKRIQLHMKVDMLSVFYNEVKCFNRLLRDHIHTCVMEMCAVLIQEAECFFVSLHPARNKQTSKF